MHFFKEKVLLIRKKGDKIEDKNKITLRMAQVKQRGLNSRERREETLTDHRNSVYSEKNMGFFGSAITILQTLVVAIGAGLGVWGVINLMEGYGNDNPGAKSQGIKQLMSGGGVILIGTQLIPLLSGLFG